MKLFKLLLALAVIGTSISGAYATVNGGKRPGEYTISPDGNVNGPKRPPRLTASVSSVRECEYGYENCSCLGDTDRDDDDEWDGNYYSYYEDDEGNEYMTLLSWVEDIGFDEDGLFVLVDEQPQQVIQMTMVSVDIALVSTVSRGSDVMRSSTEMAGSEALQGFLRSNQDWLGDGLYDWQCPNDHWVKPGCDICPRCGFDRKKSPAAVRTPTPNQTPSNHPAGHSNHPITNPTINNHPIKAP